jgi:hypothetical protein
MTSSAAQSLVDRLYAAFNDPGILGLGGTDEDAVMQALSEAKAKNLMHEVDALYNSRYAEKELNLKDELDDELSGEDYEKAMRLYDDGMAAPQDATASARKVAVHGTMTPRASVDVRTFFDNIIIDWENSEHKKNGDQERTDITKETWENAVWDVLDFLYNKSPFETARAILDAIKDSGKKLTIFVEEYAFVSPNSHAFPTDPAAATRNGGTPEGETPGTGGGAGGGSDAVIRFTPQDWEAESSSASIKARDETLLHELFHALRQMRGLEDEVAITAPFATMNRGEGSDAELIVNGSPLNDGPKEKENPHREHYGSQEEFFSVVLTNIHRSEKGRAGVKRDHVGDNMLVPPMNNAANFASTWKPQLHFLCEDMPDVCRRVAGALGNFNPVFELYRLEDRYPAGAARNAPTAL